MEKCQILSCIRKEKYAEPIIRKMHAVSENAAADDKESRGCI